MEQVSSRFFIYLLAFGFITVVLLPSLAVAEGALAVGVPSDVAKMGFAAGEVVNKTSADEAQKGALEKCRKPNPTIDKRAQALCTLVNTFHEQCVAVAEDPKEATPGVGWAISSTLQMAESQALANCRATAGKSRRDFCKVVGSECDGAAK